MSTYLGDWECLPRFLVPGARTQFPSRPLLLTEAIAPLVPLDETIYSGLVLMAQVSPLLLQPDHTAGPIFHFQDERNFYLLQADSHSGTLDPYKVTHGRRIKVAGAGAAAEPDQWQGLRVEVLSERDGISVRAFLGGRQAFRTTDDTFTVGKIGLFASGSRSVCFDNVEAGAT